jgi:hypothetical protein
MQSLLLQLQGECLDSSVSIPDVLRKALVVARKLGVKDFQTWIEKALNGYPVRTNQWRGTPINAGYTSSER